MPISFKMHMLQMWNGWLYNTNLRQVFGKYPSELLPGQIVKPRKDLLAMPHSVEIIQRKTIVDFIISHASEDRRPYMEVSILARSMLGLLDSGSNRTLVGKNGCDILLSLGLVLNISRQTICTVADGSTCAAVGAIRTPICLINKAYILDILVVPSLSPTLILGMDFWLSIDVILGMGKNNRFFQPALNRNSNKNNLQD